MAIAFVARLFSSIASPQAADVAIDDFYGRWAGEEIAKTETGNDTERQALGLEVIVRAHPARFQLYWSTARVVLGRADRQSFAMLLFAPTVQIGSWRATFSADGSTRKGRARAEMNDRTLQVFNRATNVTGDTELQIYERTLSRDGMDLHFTRFDNDELVRVVQGRLVSVERVPGETTAWCSGVGPSRRHSLRFEHRSGVLYVAFSIFSRHHNGRHFIWPLHLERSRP